MDGIILDNLRNKKEIKLPKSKATVWVWDELLAGDVLGGMQINALNKLESANPIMILMSVIADWNFIDKDGNKLPINEDNIRKLSIEDFVRISKEVEDITTKSGLTIQEKKA